MAEFRILHGYWVGEEVAWIENGTHRYACIVPSRGPPWLRLARLLGAW